MARENANTRGNGLLKIVGMMTVRDEEDILEESGIAAARAYDWVLAVDCGSTDRTPELLQRLSERFENFVTLGSIEPMTSMQVKRHIWSAFRRQMRNQDWWGFADADEFVDPKALREVTAYATKRFHDHIYGEHVNFYYTSSDYEKWQSGQETLESRSLPISERRRYYRFHTQQIRLFRNLPWLRWNEDSAFPKNLSCLSDRRILYRHYQYRDPAQIERRIAIRRKEFHRSHPSNTHWLKDSLEDAISPSDDRTLQYDNGEGYVKDEALAPLRQQPVMKTFAKYYVNTLRGLTTLRKEERWFHAKLG